MTDQIRFQIGQRRRSAASSQKLEKNGEKYHISWSVPPPWDAATPPRGYQANFSAQALPICGTVIFPASRAAYGGSRFTALEHAPCVVVAYGAPCFSSRRTPLGSDRIRGSELAPAEGCLWRRVRARRSESLRTDALGIGGEAARKNSLEARPLYVDRAKGRFVLV